MVILPFTLILIGLVLIITAIYRGYKPKDYLTVEFINSSVNNNPHNDYRRIDGHKPDSSDDWDRYWVKVGLSDGYSSRLSDIESLLKKRDTENAKALYDEWKYRYEKYSSLCRELGIYNRQIGINEPYTGVGMQNVCEQQLFGRIESLYTTNEDARNQYQSSKTKILDYLLTQPYHRAIRSVMLKEIANGQSQMQRQLSSDYKLMVKNRILIERKEADGKYSVRKAPVARKRKASSQKQSVYSSDWYAMTSRKTEYKVEFTVSRPQNVNSITNTGEFISISRGERYYTSLEHCTCPAFHGRSSPPCKHMVALANHLGYYKRHVSLIKIQDNS